MRTNSNVFFSCTSMAPCVPSFRDLDYDSPWAENPPFYLHFPFFCLAQVLRYPRFKLSDGFLYCIHTVLQRGLPVRWLCTFYHSLLYNFVHVSLVKIMESRTQSWRPKISCWCLPHFPRTVMTMLKESKRWKEKKTSIPAGLLKNQVNMFWKGTVLF